jgi:hypothetical protein
MTSVSVSLSNVRPAAQLGLQLGEVLDDAVVHQGDAAGGVGVGVGDVGRAVGGPADVADAVLATSGCSASTASRFADLALGPAALDLAVHDGGDAGRVVAAVFEPLEAVDQPVRDGLGSDDADDAAHGP